MSTIKLDILIKDRVGRICRRFGVTAPDYPEAFLHGYNDGLRDKPLSRDKGPWALDHISIGLGKAYTFGRKYGAIDRERGEDK